MALIINQAHRHTENSIVVQTRLGANVENNQHKKIEGWELAKADEIRKRYNLAIFRTEPCGMYNCHGLTFASRRTRIYEPKEIAKILDHDYYQELDIADLLPGDIVVYYDSGDAQHSGIIIRVDSVGTAKVPIVVSKWGNGQEVIHQVTMCPYFTGAQIRYYRVRATGGRG